MDIPCPSQCHISGDPAHFKAPSGFAVHIYVDIAGLEVNPLIADKMSEVEVFPVLFQFQILLVVGVCVVPDLSLHRADLLIDIFEIRHCKGQLSRLCVTVGDRDR